METEMMDPEILKIVRERSQPDIAATICRDNDTAKSPRRLHFLDPNRREVSNKETAEVSPNLVVENQLRSEATSATPNGKSTLADFHKNLQSSQELAAQRQSEPTTMLRVNAISVETTASDPIAVPLVTATLASDSSSGDNKRYELVAGLWAELSSDAILTMTNDCELTVRANNVAFGDRLFVGEGINLRAVLSYNKGGEMVVQQLQVSLEKLAVDPLASRDQVAAFRQRFGHNKDSNTDESQATQRDLPSGRLSQKQWNEWIKNARNDVRVEEKDSFLPAVNTTPQAPPEDIQLPFARVESVQCSISNSASIIDFPESQGSEGCSLKSMLEYYLQVILHEMGLQSGEKASLSTRAVVSDVTSVVGSAKGAVIGGLMLGPAGYVAGSLIGSQIGRSNIGATAGLALFGPLGFVGGACVEPSAQNTNDTRAEKPKTVTTISEKGSRNLGDRAKDHIKANKYEYAGSTGVVAGAMAGSVLGPIGTITGAVAGAVSSRKLVEKASNNNAGRPNQDDASGRKPYRFGDLTRRAVARGKEARGAQDSEGYRFGDFSRGLFGGQRS